MTHDERQAEDDLGCEHCDNRGCEACGREPVYFGIDWGIADVWVEHDLRTLRLRILRERRIAARKAARS